MILYQILSAFSSKLELQLSVQAPVCILNIHHNKINFWNNLKYGQTLWNWKKKKLNQHSMKAYTIGNHYQISVEIKIPSFQTNFFKV